MRKIREVLRLTWEAADRPADGGSLQLARSTVGACLRRFHESGLSWPLPTDLSDADLETAVVSRRTAVAGPDPSGAGLGRGPTRNSSARG